MVHYLHYINGILPTLHKNAYYLHYINGTNSTKINIFGGKIKIEPFGLFVFYSGQEPCRCSLEDVETFHLKKISCPIRGRGM